MPLHLTSLLPVGEIPSPVGLEEGYPVMYGGHLYVVRDGAFESLDRYHEVGDSTSSLELDFSEGSVWDITLTANCTLTFVGMVGVMSATMILHQDGTGNRTVTWPGSVVWAGGTPPTLSTGVGAVDVVRLFTPDGVTVFGTVAGLDFS